MSQRAQFVNQIVVKDPDTKGEIHLSVYKHENGGMFAMDSSYIEQVLADDDEVMELVIPDPFAKIGEPENLYLEGE